MPYPRAGILTLLLQVATQLAKVRKVMALGTAAASFILAASPAPGTIANNHAIVQAEVTQTYGKLPLSFEANHGQTDPQVKFLARGPGYSLFLTAKEAVMALSADCHGGTGSRDARKRPGCSRQAVLNIGLAHASGTPEPVGIQPLPGIANYFIGNDPKAWHTNIPTYAQVKYSNVYRGIDLVYYGNHRQLEYDFLVAAGADPGAIALSFRGARRLRVDRSGNLVLELGGAEVIEHAPVVYQEIEGRRQPVSSCYALRGKGEVGFSLGPYDRTRPLVIDPTLQYSTYLGGNGYDSGSGIAVDSSGNAYVTGFTDSTNFPTAPGAFQTSFGGGSFNAFVSKLDATGSALLYSTYLGGSGDDAGAGITVDSAGDAYVTGSASSSNFPTTPGALQTTYGGRGNAFVSKLNAAGSALLYSTYLGGSGGDGGSGIAIDSAGNAYVTGGTTSQNFPTTLGAFQTTYGGGQDAFVTKLNAVGSALLYSTYLGGIGTDGGSGIAVDSVGDAYITGTNYNGNFPTTPHAFQTSVGGIVHAFVSKLNAAGSALLYSTYLGGNGADFANGIAIDSAGNAYVTGGTTSQNFPTTPSAFQTTYPGVGADSAFVSKLNTAGSALVYSTYLGGSVSDSAAGIAVDSVGNAYVTGSTVSANFPTTPGAFQTSYGGGIDIFVSQLNPAGSGLLYSTYLGSDSSGSGIAIDSAGNTYVTGNTQSPNFPTIPGSFQTTLGGGGRDAFVSKFSVSLSVTMYEYDFFAPGTNTVVASFLFPGFVRDVSPASYPVPGFTGFISPSPASLVPCDLTSNSSAELDCRARTVHSGIFYFVFDYGAFPSKLGPFTGSGFVAPDGANPGLGTVILRNGQVTGVAVQP